MKTQNLSQNLSVINTELNRGIKKIYNLHCLKFGFSNLNPIEIVTDLNAHPLSKFDCFESLFNEVFPKLSKFFSTDKRYYLNVSIDRVFFSPFNMYGVYREYGFRLGYLKDKFSFLNDKIPICLVDVYRDDLLYRYVFFVKEVCNG